MILPNPLAALLGTFSGLFSGRIWQQVQILVGGVILCPSKRTVRARLRIRGLAADRRHGQSQRGLSRTAWASCLGAPPLLKPLIGTLVATGGIGLGLDDPIQRRKGKRIRVKDRDRAAVRSRDSPGVNVSGFGWLHLMLGVEIPWQRGGEPYPC